MKPKICIVISTYNSGITNKLLFSAKNELKKYGVTKTKDFKVPGAFEIPVVIARLAKKYDAFIAIGCIIKGKTDHYDFIANAITKTLLELSIQKKLPISNSVLTCKNIKQAKERSTKKLNRAKEAVEAAIAVLQD